MAFLTAVAIGVVTGRLVGTWMNRRKPAAQPSSPPGRVPRPGAPDERLRGLPCALGDVIVLAHGDEAWLAGGLVFRERVAHRDETGESIRTASALLVGPDRQAARAIYARPAPSASLDWMWPLHPEALVVGKEPPSSIEHDGERFERVRRLPLALVAVGEGAPDLGSEALVGEYEGAAGARLLIVIGATMTQVWRGRRLEEGMYDLLPGGATVAG